MSGLAGDPRDADTLWAVSDSFRAQAFIYRVDVSGKPAVIEQRIPVGGVGVADQRLGDYDLEGIAARPEGGFWLASEGRVDVGSSRPNLIVRTDAAGAVLESVPLPDALVAGATSSGFEGVAVTGSAAGHGEAVWVAIQREWADEPKGFVKLGRYDVAAGAWTFAHYPLDAVESPSGGWVGLSEITLLRSGRLALPVLRKTLLRDVLDDLDARSISVPDKLEGLGVAADGRVYLATDNDGVDENYGETLFFGLRGLR